MKVVQWLIVVAIVAAIIFRSWLNRFVPSLSQMTGPYVLLFAFSLAFTWVEIMQWGSIKPFNCVKCLTGWFALILAFLFHTQFWYLYLPAGLMVGAIYSAVKMRWL